MFEQPRDEAPHGLNPIAGRYDRVGEEPSRGYPWDADLWIGEDFLSYRPRPFTAGDGGRVVHRLRIVERTPTSVTARVCRDVCSRVHFQLGRASGGTRRALRVRGLDGPGSVLELVGDPYRIADCERGLRPRSPVPPLGEGGASP